MSKQNFVDTSNPKSRPTGAYAEVIAKIADDGVCPFCPKHLKEYHKLPVEEKQFWTITENMYAYKPSLHHCLLIHREHISHIDEISEQAWAELLTIAKEETKKRSIVGGTLIMRFGETRYTGGSVNHLHAHIVQSNPDDPNYNQEKGLTMRIG